MTAREEHMREGKLVELKVPVTLTERQISVAADYSLERLLHNLRALALKRAPSLVEELDLLQPIATRMWYSLSGECMVYEPNSGSSTVVRRVRQK